MNVKMIRAMSDEELEEFLSRISYKKTNHCSKCLKASNKAVKIENKETFQTKKLCMVCEDCYKKLVEFLNTNEIDWSE